MKTVTVEDAARRLQELVDGAEQGECVTITRDGSPVAQIVPVADEPQARTRAEVIEDILEFGRQHKGALRGLSIRDLIDEGRRY